MRILGGKFKGRKLVSPQVRTTRMMTSSLKTALFDTLRPYMENSVVLDLFAGSGAVGIEALSQGAKFAYFVDINRVPIDCIRQNISQLKLESCSKILKADAFKVLSQLECEPIDILILCPPYPFTPEQMKELILLADKRSELFSDDALVFFELPKQYRSDIETLELKNFQIKKTRPSGTSFVIFYERRQS